MAPTTAAVKAWSLLAFLGTIVEAYNPDSCAVEAFARQRPVIVVATTFSFSLARGGCEWSSQHALRLEDISRGIIEERKV
eukprot:5074096-Prymnesium_polylepis.3